MAFVAQEPAPQGTSLTMLPDHVLAEIAWPDLSEQQRALVELVARDLHRAGQSAGGTFDALPEARKTALRGAAMRQLGIGAETAKEDWI